MINPRPLPAAAMVEWMQAFGYDLRTLPPERWRALLIERLEAGEDNALAPFLPLFKAAEAATEAAEAGRGGAAAAGPREVRPAAHMAPETPVLRAPIDPMPPMNQMDLMAAMPPEIPEMPSSPQVALDRETAATGVRYDCARTVEALAASGINCPPLDARLLEVYFNSYIRSGYLPAPAAATAAVGSRSAAESVSA